MPSSSAKQSGLYLIAIALLFTGLSLTGITWGLPSRKIDKYLFGDRPVWSGEKIYRLAGGAEKFTDTRGADVDVDPLQRGDDPVLLTATEEDVARIYLRYRLYTYQPDEMIAMMALARMKPRDLDFDPRLYQYGGLFIYPVGALIGIGGALGLIDVRSDVSYYLDHPDEFGKFYMVARGYAAAWGVVGVFVVFGIARRLGGDTSGLLAALLFTLMPVVICMAHEGKPHLPGAVLMLAAVYFAMRSYRSKTGWKAGPTDWWLMCICCGAALGMVLSALPVFVLIPLVAWLDRGQKVEKSKPRWNRDLRSRKVEIEAAGNRQPPARRDLRQATGGADTTPADPSRARKEATPDPSRAREEAVGSQQYRARKEADPNQYRDRQGADSSAIGSFIARTLSGVAIAAAVYLITNPYIVINALTNRDILRSNFGNSLAMYEVARIGEGFTRVLELTAEGATWPIVIFGFIAAALMIKRKKWNALPLAIVALVFFLQFVLIGAGKPGEYGRFGIFTNTALAIGAAVVCIPRINSGDQPIRRIMTIILVLAVGWSGSGYLQNFVADIGEENSRMRIAEVASRWTQDVLARGERPAFAVRAEPAPYCFPPIDFARADVALPRSPEGRKQISSEQKWISLGTTDKTRRSAPRSEGSSGLLPRGDLDPRKVCWRDSRLSTLGSRRETEISWSNKPFYQYWMATKFVRPKGSLGDELQKEGAITIP